MVNWAFNGAKLRFTCLLNLYKPTISLVMLTLKIWISSYKPFLAITYLTATTIDIEKMGITYTALQIYQ